MLIRPNPSVILNASAFLLYGIGDTLTTFIAISGGFSYEHNPLMAPLIAEGWHIFIPLKLCVLVMGLLGLYTVKIAFGHRATDRMYLGCLLALSGWGAFLTIGNSLVILGVIG